MKLPSLRLFLLLPAAAMIAMVFLNSCCCPCDSKAALMEDFWVSPERQIEWLQQLRMTEGIYVPDETVDYDQGYGASK